MTTTMTDSKPILVTGCSSGIGKAIAMKLASSGHIVYATARKQTDLDELDKIPNIYSCKLDVRDLEDVKNLKKFIQEKGRGLYAVVNNAGIGILGPMIETNDKELNDIFDINLFAPIRIVKNLIEYLIESKGRIVNIGSITGILSPVFIGAYSMTKHALAALTELYNSELNKFAIHASIVEAGGYQSKITQEYNDNKDINSIYYQNELSDFIENAYILKQDKLPPPDNVAMAVEKALFDENPRSHYLICDQKFEVDGVLEKTINDLVQYFTDNDNYVTKTQLIELFKTKLDQV